MSSGIKINFLEAKNRFINNNINDILICEKEYKSWKEKCKFYDLIQQDYFWSIPANVYKLHIVHPKRRKQKSKQTSLKKYGTEHPFQNEDIKQKYKNTCKKKFGVEYSLQSKNIRDKSKQTSKEIYGSEYPQQSDVVKNKLSSSIKKKYYLTNNEVNILSKRFILETKEHLSSWLEKQPEPKPAYITITQNFPNDYIKLIDLKRFIRNYKNYKSSLETLCENLFKLKHYNKFIANLNYKPDFKLSDSIYLNVDGLYWHSELNKNKYYHFNMRKTFENNNLRLFQFREDEIKNKPEIIKSIVNNSLNKTPNKIYARKCVIKEVNQKDANIFLCNNHLMGTTKAKHIGLYYKENLASLLSYKFTKNICKIERFCSLTDYNIIGGFNKLLVYIENNNKQTTEIHNWVDLRYGSGEHLLNKGFKQIKETLGWKWTNGHKTFNRFKCRANMDHRKLSQKEYAKELNLNRIYDAGQRLYIKSLK